MIITLDIGGTSTRIAFSQDGKKFDDVVKFPTHKNYKESLLAISETITEYSQSKKIQGIVAGVPGVLNKNKTKITTVPHLPNWQNKPFVKDLENKFKTRVYLENDTDLGGLGEATQGAGKGKNVIAYLAIGTGFGGVRIVNGQIDASSQGFEPGHMIINAQGETWNACQQKGCLESYVSGSAFIERYGFKKCAECTDKKIWDEIAQNLAVGLVNITVLWSPDVIVLGGGVMKAGKYLLDPTKKYFNEYLKVFKVPSIKTSKLKDRSNLYGGLHYIQSKL